MKRLVIFASFDKKGIIHDYVLSYLRYLKEIADNIIFIADNEASPNEQIKLKNLCCHCEFVRHNEYDFGSYKRGFNWAKNNGLLDDTDELILCNDSCFCTSSFENVFAFMSKKQCDFWGMTASNEIKTHLQSYFLDFKKSVFTSKHFISFINGITRQYDTDAVILNYEIPLKKFLEEKGFTASAFFEARDNFNPTIFYPLSLLKYGIPLLKKKFFNLWHVSKEKPDDILVFLKENYPSCCKDIFNYEKAVQVNLLTKIHKKK